MSEKSFLIEKRLRELQPELHQRFSDAIYALLNPLSGYKLHFPEYPQRFALPNGNTICLPYLAAILRLADELDVTDERNGMRSFCI